MRSQRSSPAQLPGESHLRGVRTEGGRERKNQLDFDALLATRERFTELTTTLNRKNQEANQRQKARKRKMEPSEREPHAVAGRPRINQEVVELERHLQECQENFEEQMPELPNFVHSEVPEGSEDGYRQLRTWGEVPDFDFEPRDHLAPHPVDPGHDTGPIAAKGRYSSGFAPSAPEKPATAWISSRVSALKCLKHCTFSVHQTPLNEPELDANERLGTARRNASPVLSGS